MKTSGGRDVLAAAPGEHALDVAGDEVDLEELTMLPGRRCLRLVIATVCGMRLIEKSRAVTAFTVRLTPLIVIEPFFAM